MPKHNKVRTYIQITQGALTRSSKGHSHKCVAKPRLGNKKTKKQLHK